MFYIQLASILFKKEKFTNSLYFLFQTRRWTYCILFFRLKDFKHCRCIVIVKYERKVYISLYFVI